MSSATSVSSKSAEWLSRWADCETTTVSRELNGGDPNQRKVGSTWGMFNVGHGKGESTWIERHAWPECYLSNSTTVYGGD